MHSDGCYETTSPPALWNKLLGCWAALPCCLQCLERVQDPEHATATAAAARCKLINQIEEEVEHRGIAALGPGFCQGQNAGRLQDSSTNQVNVGDRSP